MMNVEQLEAEYNQEGDGEHPTYPRDDWRDAVERCETLLGYWEWVSHRLTSEPHAYICAVRLAFKAKSPSDANDKLNELLSTHMRGKKSDLLDWNYDEWGYMQAIPVSKDFGEDSGVPQLHNRSVKAE